MNQPETRTVRRFGSKNGNEWKRKLSRFVY